MNFMPDELIGERVVLRAIVNPTLELAAEFDNMRAGGEEHFAEFENISSSPSSPEDRLDWFKWMAENRDKKVYYLIYAGDEMIGAIIAQHYSERDRNCEIGYHLKESATGKGYMMEAMQLVMRALQDGGLMKLKAGTDAGNERSTNLLKKLEYQLEGILKKDYYLKSKGEFRDYALYAKIYEENAGQVK